MGLLVVILLVVLGIALLIAIVKAIIWLAILAIVVIAGLVAWQRLSSWYESNRRGTSSTTV